MENLIQFITGASPLLLILMKTTILLIIGWGFHFVLLGCNPRWRVFTWRIVLVGLLLLPIVEYLIPKIYIQVPAKNQYVETNPGIENYFNKPQEKVFENQSTLPLVSENNIYTKQTFSIYNFIKRNSTALFIIVWLIGIMVLAIRLNFIFYNLKIFANGLQSAPEYIYEIANNISNSYDKKIDIRIMDRFGSPFMSGIFKPVLVLPDKMIDEKYSKELPLIIAHELAHVRSQDLLWILAARWITVILWFHPLIWKLCSAHNAACEQVCDAVAAEYAGSVPYYTKTLARTALEITDNTLVPGGIHIIGTSEITKRLRNLSKGIRAANLKKHKVVVSIILSCMILIAIGGLKIAYANKLANEESSEMLQTTVKVVDESDNPVEGVKITPYALRSKMNPGSHYGWQGLNCGDPVTITTNSFGAAEITYPKYIMEKLETGTVSLKIDHPDFVYKKTDYTLDGYNEPIVLEKGASFKVSGYMGERKLLSSEIYPQIISNQGYIVYDNESWKKHDENSLVNTQIPEGTNFLRLVYISDNGIPFFSKTIRISTFKGGNYEHNLELKPGIRLEGKLENSVPRPVKNGRLAVIVTPNKFKKESGRLMWRTWREIKEDGTFIIESLPEGYVDITAICDGFYSKDPQDNIDNFFCIPQAFILNKDIVNVELSMEPTAVFEVKVFDENNNPVKGAEVSFWPNVKWSNNSSQIFCDCLYRDEDLIHENNQDYMDKLGEKWERERKYWATSNEKGIAIIKNLPAKKLAFGVICDNLELPAGGKYNQRNIEVQLVSGETTTGTINLQKKGKDYLGETQPYSNNVNQYKSTVDTTLQAQSEIRIKCVSESGIPIEGVEIGIGASCSDYNNNKWRIYSGSEKLWITDGQGIVSISPDFKEKESILLYAWQQSKNLAGLLEISKEDLGKSRDITLYPVCHVTGEIISSELDKLEQSMEFTIAYIYYRDYRILNYTAQKNRFEFFLPPGNYKIKTYGTGTYDINTEFEVPAEQTET